VLDIVSDLALYCRETGVTPFEYGAHDCGMWCAGWLDRRAGGSRFKEGLRALYRDKRSAVRMLRDVGHRYQLLVEPFLGPPLPRLTLQVGSVVVIRASWHRDGLGILAPSQVIGLAASGQVLALPRDVIVEGWPCPR